MASPPTTNGATQQGHLRRTLTLWNLIIYGVIVIQPTAPMPSFGVISQEARGHVVTAILIAMLAMLFIAYGAYETAGFRKNISFEVAPE
jgi:putrescine importer